MKYILKSVLLMFTLCLAFGLASLKSANHNESRIKIVNKSSWAIDHIYFSPVDKNTWGKDILGKNEVLEPNESITVLVDCDIWDVKFVAADGAECIVEDIDICEVEGVWTIDDLGCE